MGLSYESAQFMPTQVVPRVVNYPLDIWHYGRVLVLRHRIFLIHNGVYEIEFLYGDLIFEPGKVCISSLSMNDSIAI